MKECPFCGNTNGTIKKRLTKDIAGRIPLWEIKMICKKCGVEGPPVCSDSKDIATLEAIKAWNHRFEVMG